MFKFGRSFDFVLPGIKVIIVGEGCEFRWNGVLPVCEFGTCSEVINIKVVEALMETNNYSAIKDYIKVLARKCKSVTS